ncbi:hypothetical protein PNOK_0785600 [Pyrrhoderma noxium]|uniref:Uncharacterized protein n=1 Tax=Pyrrhoderma noxium TaxID=2282107 RepID=A0A286U9L8_9AGAM|nr:hypothetical protein PNOK_0785600 [Pyrrhoderma noxium]
MYGLELRLGRMNILLGNQARKSFSSSSSHSLDVKSECSVLDEGSEEWQTSNRTCRLERSIGTLRSIGRHWYQKLYKNLTNSKTQWVLLVQKRRLISLSSRSLSQNTPPSSL